MLLLAACLTLGSLTGHADSVSGLPRSEVVQNPDQSYSVNVYTYSTVQVVPLYRFYNPYLKDYFWTASADEKLQLEQNYRTGKETYQFEGIVGYVEQTASNQNLPVYRFWNRKTADHFYTTSAAEKQQLEADLASGKDNYVYEGIAWYVPETSAHPVYRFFDTAAYNHFYTSDPQLQVSLSQAFINGTGTYRYEGIAWYWYE